MMRVSKSSAHRLLAGTVAAAVLALGATAPVFAQGKPDPTKQAEMTARAEKEAKTLREEQATVKPLVAMVPVTPDNVWVLDLSDGGQVKILLRPDVAPETVARIKGLTSKHFYDGLLFHRVIDGFMAQGGDPKGDGTGGSELPDLKQEFNWLPHMRGAVAMARAENEDSANSQFFIMLMPRLQLDHKYTVFGRVISGMKGVDDISKGEPPANPTKIVRAYIESEGAAATAPISAPPAG